MYLRIIAVFGPIFLSCRLPAPWTLARAAPGPRQLQGLAKRLSQIITLPRESLSYSHSSSNTASGGDPLQQRQPAATAASRRWYSARVKCSAALVARDAPPSPSSPPPPRPPPPRPPPLGGKSRSSPPRVCCGCAAGEGPLEEPPCAPPGVRVSSSSGGSSRAYASVDSYGKAPALISQSRRDTRSVILCALLSCGPPRASPSPPSS